MIRDLAQAIQIVQCMACRQHTVLRHRAGEGHVTGQGVVDVGNRRRGRAGHVFQCAGEVGILSHNPDPLPHVTLGQCHAVSGRIRHGGPGNTIGGSLPLIDNVAQAIQIVQGMVCRQDAVLLCGSGEGDFTGWRVVDIGNRHRHVTGYTFRCIKLIGVTGHNPNKLPHLTLGQCERGIDRPR